MREKGLFITFEGNDGSGKTTQIRKLMAWLESRGHQVVFVREPGGTEIGEKIRNLVLDRANAAMCPVSEMLLYAASRAQLVHEVIKPSLQQGCVVICDRYVDSAYAYQGFGRELGLDTVMNVNAPAIDGVLPDLTFFMDLDAGRAMERRNATGEVADRIEVESMDFHWRTYHGYRTLAETWPERFRALDVARPAEAIFTDIERHVEDWLTLRG